MMGTHLHAERVRALAADFQTRFGNPPELFVSSPGRIEVCGNHCDHQNGCVVAAAVDADNLAAVSRSGDEYVRVVSPGHREIVLSLSDLTKQKEETGHSPAIVRGIAAALVTRDIPVCGINVLTNSHVPAGSGLSSSAAFENLITLAFLEAAESELPVGEIARIGQYSENEYYGKPSGLMDQMASAVGGLIFIDFKTPEALRIEKSGSGLLKQNINICITNTGGSHAGLTGEYGAIPLEMKKVAEFFGKKVLREVREEEFCDRLAALREYAGDRAVLRAMHFFDENKRAAECRDALNANDRDLFLDVIRRSGESSWKYLQNIYPSGSTGLQEQAIGLALSEKILAGKGAWRIHGGGFAGTIQAFVPDELLERYTSEMIGIFGPDTCLALTLRDEGVCIYRSEHEDQ